MVEVKKYYLPPTALVPNSPLPLLHYPGLLSPELDGAAVVYDKFARNGWEVQWVYRYGQTQKSHYHSSAHECMAVLSGTATLRFGVADTTSDMQENTFGDGKESGGIEVQAKAGDVFVLPAGTAHKTYNTQPPQDLKLLTPGNGHVVAAADPRSALAEMKLSGYTMIGAYPQDGGPWDSKTGGEGNYEKVWATPKPGKDPVLGSSPEGLCGTWS